MRHLLAALASGGAFALVLIVSRGQPGRGEPSERSKFPPALGAIHPRLSPDGSSLAFSYQGGLWVAPARRRHHDPAATAEGDDTEPAWSPDGKRIAFVRGSTVKLVDSAGGKDVPLPKALQVAGTYGANKLEFSADGRQLLGAFRSDARDHGLAWFDLATGAVRPVTPVHYYTASTSRRTGSGSPTAPPDQPGEQTGTNGSYTDVWKTPADGGNTEKVCRFPARIHDLCWADGGRSLVVAAELGQAHDDLWKLPLDDPLRGMVKITAGRLTRIGRRPPATAGGWPTPTTATARPRSSSATPRRAGRRPSGSTRWTTAARPVPCGLRVVDAATKEPVVARISLKEDGGRFHAPPGSLHRSLRGQGHFYCDQAASGPSRPATTGYGATAARSTASRRKRSRSGPGRRGR